MTIVLAITQAELEQYEEKIVSLMSGQQEHVTQVLNVQMKQSQHLFVPIEIYQL